MDFSSKLQPNQKKKKKVEHNPRMKLTTNLQTPPAKMINNLSISLKMMSSLRLQMRTSLSQITPIEIPRRHLILFISIKLS